MHERRADGLQTRSARRRWLSRRVRFYVPRGRRLPRPRAASRIPDPLSRHIVGVARLGRERAGTRVGAVRAATDGMAHVPATVWHAMGAAGGPADSPDHLRRGDNPQAHACRSTPWGALGTLARRLVSSDQGADLVTGRSSTRRVELRVFYSAATEPNRRWSVDRDLAFGHEIVAGPSLGVRGRVIYVTPRLLSRLLAFRPSVVVAGGFSLPTIYAFAFCLATGAKLIIMNEGTRHTER